MKNNIDLGVINNNVYRTESMDTSSTQVMQQIVAHGKNIRLN